MLKRFKFTLKDNYNFNYKLLINIIYLTKKPILHTINRFISF
jgi:hypothetical protein